MDIQVQAEKAERLRKLHQGSKLLLLPNAWDVASARVVEELGFPAIATTSAGVAASLGYTDGQKVSRDEMLEAVGRIARAVKVPVTADMEAGYGTTPEEMVVTAQALIAAGGVGLNFEDITGADESSHVPLALQLAKIRAIKETAAAAGVPVVLNARTDIYLMPIGPASTRFERSVERLRAYRAAGADCLFAPGVSDQETIAKLVKALEAPLNILLTPDSPPLRELEKMGVARASTGSALMRASMGTARRAAKQMLTEGSCKALFEGPVPYAELMEMMGRSNS
ncbi:MAG TPA: isocitrate lyase/phosphoenolpyruvate mutase family protein [Candidatus Saccharimonadales bacterium]|nr:isocitrate lyase/phosphoenolpyruvate mutase family protein [Candidatus Saccharimonadales bacterium]